MNKEDLLRKANQRAKHIQDNLEDTIDQLSYSDIRKLVNELSVYKIELEMQNEELLNAQMQLKASNAYYSDLFELAPIGHVIINGTSEITRINKWMVDFINHDKSDILGRKISDFIFPEDQDAFYFILRDGIKYDKHLQREIRIGSQIGGYRWCLIDSRRIGDNEDELFLSFVDIEYKILMENGLRSEKMKAERLNYAKSQFLANMSHEIRTPMNGLMGILQLLEFTGLSEEQSELVEISKSSAYSLLSTLNAILDYSKIEEKMVVFENIEFNVAQLMAEVKSLFYPSARNKKIGFNTLISSNVPEILVGDSFRIKQVLNNLVGNAIKFTSEGEINVMVECVQCSESNKVEIEFQVQDTGIGISENALETIFERFSQADTSNTRKYGGTGLGLAICKGLAEQMGGRVLIDSQVGKGTTVRFRALLTKYKY